MKFLKDKYITTTLSSNLKWEVWAKVAKGVWVNMIFKQLKEFRKACEKGIVLHLVNLIYVIDQSYP